MLHSLRASLHLTMTRHAHSTKKCGWSSIENVGLLFGTTCRTNNYQKKCLACKTGYKKIWPSPDSEIKETVGSRNLVVSLVVPSLPPWQT